MIQELSGQYRRGENVGTATAFTTLVPIFTPEMVEGKKEETVSFKTGFILRTNLHGAGRRTERGLSNVNFRKNDCLTSGNAGTIARILI